MNKQKRKDDEITLRATETVAWVQVPMKRIASGPCPNGHTFCWRARCWVKDKTLTAATEEPEK